MKTLKEIWFFARHIYLMGQELQANAANCKNCGWAAWKCFSEGPCCSGCDH